MSTVAKRRNLSIRYKILLLLTLVPLVTLSLYLAMAVQVFKNDKLAYVFESSLSSARTLSSQASTEINGLMTTAKPAMQEFLLERNFGKVSQAIFETEGQLEWMAAFNATAGGFDKLAIVERAKGSGEKDLLTLGQKLMPLFAEMNQKDRLVRAPFNDDRILLMERVGRDATNPGFVFMMIGHLTELATSFRTAGSEVYLVNEQGQVLFGPTDTEGSKLTEKLPADFIGEFKGQNSSGTKEVQSLQGSTLLASFSKTSFNGLTVVSLVNKKDALAAVSDLLRRSLVFFLLLISASTVVSLFASGTLTSALTDLFSATKKVAEGNFDFQVKVRSNDEIGSLADSFNAMSSEVARLMGETAEKARMESELKTAQTVQETLFPATRADLNGFKIAGYYEPASECGGDWWHYCQVGSKILLWIGDATGHGAPAALITSAAKSAATIIERLNIEPDEALSMLNRAIYDVSKGRIMMTFFLASFDLQTREFIYANASHEAPFLIQKSDQPLKKKDLIPLNEVNNPRLGQDRDTKYEQTKLTLTAGDRILFYTDGIPDIENPDKVAWGEREFIKGIISSNKDFPSISDSVDTLVHQFSEYRQKAPLKDDITFFMAHYEGDAQ